MGDPLDRDARGRPHPLRSGPGTFKTYTQEDGLPNNIIYGILEDEDGNLWMSTNQGLSKFDPRRSKFKNFDLSDGLQGMEFDGGSYHRGGAAGCISAASTGTMSFARKTSSIIHTSRRSSSPRSRCSTRTSGWAKWSGTKDPGDVDQHGGRHNAVLPESRRLLRIRRAELPGTGKEPVRLQDGGIRRGLEHGRDEAIRVLHQPPSPPVPVPRQGVEQRRALERRRSGPVAQRRPALLADLVVQDPGRAPQRLGHLFFYNQRMRAVVKKRKELESLVQQRTKELNEAYREMERLSITMP